MACSGTALHFAFFFTVRIPLQFNEHRRLSYHHLRPLSFFFSSVYPCTSFPPFARIPFQFRSAVITLFVRFKAKEKDFPSNLCVHTSSEVHPAFCPMGTGGPFPGGKALSGRDTDHSHLVPRSRIRSYTASSP
jgi:hypothetical protein